MERAEVWQVLRDKAVDLLELQADDVQEEASFGDLQLDSLSVVEYTMDLEDTLGVELPEEELSGVTTFGALLDVVTGKVAAVRSPDGGA